MREIKFRAWNLASGHYEPTRIKEIYYFNWLRLDESYIISVGAVIDEDTVIMQYTGLKDKNGKEIYEGDIVKISEIITFAEVYGWGGSFISSNEDFEMGGTCSGEREVIGNIYENEDLLK